MEKPEIIKIELPISKTHYKTATKGYLKSLIGKTANVRFSDQRNRKIFKYKITSVNDDCLATLSIKKKQCSFELKFKKKG